MGWRQDQDTIIRQLRVRYSALIKRKLKQMCGSVDDLPDINTTLQESLDLRKAHHLSKVAFALDLSLARAY